MARKAPRWVRTLVKEVRAGMETNDPIAPLGFRVEKDAEGWMICVYPRMNELLYGVKDGKRTVPGFRLCLNALMYLFDDLPHIEWETPTEFTGNYDGPCVVLDGVVQGRPVELLVFDQPPPTARLGMLVDWQRGESKPCDRPKS